MFVQIILPIIVCFVPVILAIIIFSKFQIKLIHQLLAVIIGLVAVLPISFIQYSLNNTRFLHNLTTTPILFYLITSFLVYGLLEESFKTAFLFLVPHKNYSTTQYFLLAGLTGLALAGFENVIYFLDRFHKANAKGAEFLYSLIFLRFFSADIIHFTCTAISGLFIITLRDKSLKTRWLFLLTAICLHGAYDFFAGFQNNLKWFQIMVILLAIIESRIKYKAVTTPEEK